METNSRARTDTLPNPRVLHIRAVGDVMSGTNFPRPSYLPPRMGIELWRAVKEPLRAADLSFANHEGVILNDGGIFKNCRDTNLCYLFRVPEPLSYHLLDAGIDVVSLANNHAGDFGDTGRVNTMEVLSRLGIAHAGQLQQPFCIIERQGLQIGVLAFSPIVNTPDINDLPQAAERVRALDEKVDLVVVSFHGGAEGKAHQHVPDTTEMYYGEKRGHLRAFARTVIDAGADLVLGHGPHVVRGMELYKNRLVAYSLGNFLTYARFKLRGPNGWAPMLEVHLDRRGRLTSGRIHSFIQEGEGGPKPDPQGRAFRAIRDLTEEDFPGTPLVFEPNGRFRPRGRAADGAGGRIRSPVTPPQKKKSKKD